MARFSTRSSHVRVLLRERAGPPEREAAARSARFGRWTIGVVALATFALALMTLDPMVVRGAEEKGDAEMTVTDGKQISIEYTLKLSDKTEVDSNVGEDPLTYIQGGDEILPALQAALSGLKVGDTKHIKLSAKDGYGPVDPKAFMDVDKERIPESAHKVGAVLNAQHPSGHSIPVRVSAVNKDKIKLDLNHPLAGENLVFDVKILKIEKAAKVAKSTKSTKSSKSKSAKSSGPAKAARAK
jgi:FKBP-type peptidyl-prolyl cis-trans isomerase 2